MGAAYGCAWSGSMSRILPKSLRHFHHIDHFIPYLRVNILYEKKIITLFGVFSQKIAIFAHPLGRNPAVQKAFSLVLYLEIANFKCRRTTQRMPLFAVLVYVSAVPMRNRHTRLRRGVIIFFTFFRQWCLAIPEIREREQKSSSAPFAYHVL